MVSLPGSQSGDIGSTPVAAKKIMLASANGRQPDFQSENGGSTPPASTKYGTVPSRSYKPDNRSWYVEDVSSNLTCPTIEIGVSSNR